MKINLASSIQDAKLDTVITDRSGYMLISRSVPEYYLRSGGAPVILRFTRGKSDVEAGDDDGGPDEVN